MLNIIEAFKFAFLEFQKNLIFWTGIGLAYLVLDSFLPAKNGYILSLFMIVFVFLQVGIANISLLALNNNKYNIRNLFIKPSIFFRICVIVLIQGVLCIPIMLALMTALSYPSLKGMTYFTTLSTPLIIGICVIISITIIKCLLSPFYLLDKNIGIIQSFRQSWKQCSVKVSASILLYFVGIGIINRPFNMLENGLKDYNIHFYALAFIQAIYILALAHLYMQIKRVDEKNNQ